MVSGCVCERMCLSLGEEGTSRAAADTARTSLDSLPSALLPWSEEGLQGPHLSETLNKSIHGHISLLTSKDSYFRVKTLLVFSQQLKHASVSDTRIVLRASH